MLTIDARRYDTGEPVRITIDGDRIAAVEAAVARGSEPWLLVIRGDEAPSGRPGWEQLVSNPRFSTWRFRKAS